MKRMQNYGDFIKIEHTLFSLPIILSGAFLAAAGVPQIYILVLILIAGAGARTAALGLNRIIDRKIDLLNPRTKDRGLPSGRISSNEALGIIGFGLGVYFSASYLICDLVFYLSPIPLIVFVLYPYMKRFTTLCHLGVGLGLALAPLGGWVAVRCSLSELMPAIFLSLFTLFWVSGFDVIYATLDEEFDIKSGIYSMVSVYGRKTALIVSAVFHILAFVFLLLLYLLEFNKIAAAIVLLISGILLFLEHKKSSYVNLAFFKINILIGMIVFLFVLCGIYLP